MRMESCANALDENRDHVAGARAALSENRWVGPRVAILETPERREITRTEQNVRE
jgi:hypothetical protein